ncbi:MAG TPA: DUF3472 domain-containing protein, partial [Pirellulaceae bacterium]|nr:DUF3472 domain-containing protein [Pirellulaceae bacterium]
VTAKPAGERTEFAGYFYLNDAKKWKHLVTFSTITGGKPLSGYYSFVEDFRRNGESAKLTRQARFGNGWVFTDAAKWQPLLNARFTGDSNPAVNINAGPIDDRFFLATGGAITNTGTPLNKTMDCKREAPQPPTDLPVELKAPEKSP